MDRHSKISPILPNLKDQTKIPGMVKEKLKCISPISSPRSSHAITERSSLAKLKFQKNSTFLDPNDTSQHSSIALDHWLPHRNQTPSNSAHLFRISEPEFKYHHFNSPFIKTKSDIIAALRELIAAQKQYDTSQAINRLKLLLKTLEILSNEEGKYQTEMKYIVEEIKKAVFADKEEIKPKLLEMVYEKHTDALSDLDGYIPYSYLYDILNEVNDGYIGKEIQCHKDFEEMKKKHFDEIIILEQKIAELQRIIDGKLEGNVDLSDEYKRLTDDFDRKMRELKIALAKNNELDSKLKTCKKSLKDAEFLNSDINDELKGMKEANNMLREQLRVANVDYEKLKDKCEKVSGGYSTIVYKLKQAYETNDELERRNSQLLSEKSELSVRAAAGYENLTPRPSLDTLFREFGGNFPEGHTTVEKINILHSQIVDWKNRNIPHRKTRKSVLRSPLGESPGLADEDKKGKEGAYIELLLPSSPRKSVMDKQLSWGTLLQP